MSNLDPSHAIPLLAAGALQSGMAFCIMPTIGGGFAVMLTQPEPMTDEEIELNSTSAIADTDILDTPTLTLSRQICVATSKLAGYIVDGFAKLAPEDLAEELIPVEMAAAACGADAQETIPQTWPPGYMTEAERTAVYLHEVATQETGAND